MLGTVRPALITADTLDSFVEGDPIVVGVVVAALAVAAILYVVVRPRMRERGRRGRG
jgi:hypothetical protein